MSTVVERKIVSSIPVIEVYNNELKAKDPLIIFIHGFTGSKESLIEEGKILADEGYFVVLPDAHLHGELCDPGMEKAGPYKKTGKLDEIFAKTIENIDKILKNYESSETADIEKFGLAGISLGGHVALGYALRRHNKNLKVIVPFIATPYMSRHMEVVSEGFLEAFVDEALIGRLRDFELCYDLRNIKDIPLIMVNGQNDELVPIEAARESYSRIREQYEKKDDIRLSEYKAVGHQVTKDMFNEGVLWINKFLK